VRNLRLFVETLERLGVEDEHVSMILNKAQKGTGIDADEIQRVFPRPFRSVLPFSAEVPRSVNQGQPVLATAPQDEVSRLVGKSLADFLPDDARAACESALVQTERTSLFARVRRGMRSRPATTAQAPAIATSATATPATPIPAAATQGADA
jgi:Flp pilus assembly CpaE family ATPase